jgi:hypothetical protein
MNFNKYEKFYVNKRNNIMFIFKFICPFANTLINYKANHGIALFIMSKKAYIEMKNFLGDLKSQKNLFNINKDWN